MTTIVFSHPSSVEHDTGPGHPERPDRIRAVLRVLDGEEFSGLTRREAPAAEIAQIARVHPDGYAERLLAAAPVEGTVRIDPDTVMSPESGEAALRAAGALIGAVDAVVSGEVENAFCAIRPPGHHAEPTHGMGFCLFNNVAIAAAHARAEHGLEKIAVVDFDVHHGNGTQSYFEEDPALFFGSTHEYPLYPGTGAASETGVGNIFNAPLSSGSGSEAFRARMDDLILPGLREFGPDLILISAGFDGHERDPLATLRLHEDDYGWVTGRIREIAGEHCDGRVISTLEGGYDLDALAASAAAHVHALIA
ncbi:MAG: histone deacetylase family protein [Pseudomonadota bacterium]|nr:histone deacetylase family protein [Pseudomonadota bacterium]